MKNNDLLQMCPYPFNRFLEEVIDWVIIIFDKNFTILDYNHVFEEMAGSSESEREDKKLTYYLLEMDVNDILLPEEKKFKKQQLEFLDKQSTPYPVDCYIFKVGGNYVLAGKYKQSKNNNLFEKITMLNNELTNKSRKLTKKNVQLKKQQEEIEKLLREDSLTGLANRRAFIDFYDKVYSLACRHNESLSLIMLDLDHFKEVNDKYGHGAGDFLLKKLGELLNENIRKEDMAARVGGEEFYILLPQTGEQEAKKMAERIRQGIAEISIDSVPETVTASLGVVELKEGESQENLRIRADRAMYKAKNKGRNRVETL